MEPSGLETPAASIPTEFVQLSPRDRALLGPEHVLLEPRRAQIRREYMLLGSGVILGALLVLALEAFVWFFLRTAN